VLRHAKSGWPPGVPDDERPLSGRGRRDALAAGEWLAAQGLLPDVVLCSPAARTRETWSRVAKGLAGTGSVPEASFDEAIYDASLPTLRGVVRSIDEGCRTALLIGHNPGMHDLVVDLADHEQETARALAGASFPTSGIAVLEIGCAWADVSTGRAALLEFAVPRG